MIQPVLKLDKQPVLNLLAQYPENELKDIFSELISLKLYQPPKFDDISHKVKKIVKKEALNSDIIDEAILWARNKK